MNSDATIRIRFLTSEQGGRSGPIVGPRYGCPLMVDDKGFDCRLILNASDRLELGGTYDLPVKFLNWHLAFPELEVGKSVALWEGKTIGVGEIVTIHSPTI